MNYEQTLHYLYSKLPMFTRVGEAALKKDLHNTLAMCEALGNPERQFKSIHIGGTNGKGSTSHMLAAILQQAGYKTGLYTSPHLKDFRERIKINGKMIKKSFVTGFVAQQENLIAQIEPSFFEVTVAMAFDFFAKEKVDIAIIEVGLGGRLDSTNVISPELSIITNISLDHTQILGHTIYEIAKEKAGIIKTKTPVIIGETQEESAPVFLEEGKLRDAPIIFADATLAVNHIKKSGSFLLVDIETDGIPILEKLALDLTGSYQLKNVLPVLQAIQVLKQRGFQISNNAIYGALKKVKKLTGLQGRWQTLSQKPLIICDTGHNEAGIKEVLKNINHTKHNKLHFVIGMVKDKDINTVLSMLPKDATYYFCEPQLERALAAQELSDRANLLGLSGITFRTVAEAFQHAKENASVDDLIFVGGSTFVVAEIL